MSHTRKGKIARLPFEIRHVVNTLLANGWPGKLIVEWLNEQPEVHAVLKRQFDDKPLTKQNLSEWRKGGYQEWLRNQEACDAVQRFVEQAGGLKFAAGGTEISNHVSALLSVELARVATALLDNKTDTKERWQHLQELLRNLAELRRGDHNAGRLELERQRWITQGAEKRASQKSIQQALPVCNLLMEDAARRVLATGKHYDQRAENILKSYFRAGETEKEGAEVQTKNPSPVQPSPTKSDQVQPNQTGGALSRPDTKPCAAAIRLPVKPGQGQSNLVKPENVQKTDHQGRRTDDRRVNRQVGSGRREAVSRQPLQEREACKLPGFFS